MALKRMSNFVNFSKFKKSSFNSKIVILLPDMISNFRNGLGVPYSQIKGYPPLMGRHVYKKKTCVWVDDKII